MQNKRVLKDTGIQHLATVTQAFRRTHGAFKSAGDDQNISQYGCSPVGMEAEHVYKHQAVVKINSFTRNTMIEHMLQKSEGKQTNVKKVAKQHWLEHGQVVDDHQK